MKTVTKLTDYPEYQALQSTENDLKLRLNAIEREVQAAIAKQGTTDGADRLSREVVAYLNGEPTGPARNNQEALDDLFYRRQVATKALQLHQQRMRDTKARLSAEICRELKPMYSDIIRRAADACMKLDAVLAEERAFRNELFESDVDFLAHIEPITMKGFGQEDQYSTASQFMRRAKTANYVQ